MAKPAISAVIDAYNQERFVEQAIASVLQQGLSPAEMEVIVVDDGSVDRTPEIVRKFEPRVQLICKANGGQASAFNSGIARARADIVAFLDADDWWANGKIRAVLEAFEQNREIAAVGHGYFEVLDDTLTGEMLVPQKNTVVDLSSVTAARIADPARMLLGTSRLAVRRSVLRRLGQIPTELVYAADTPIFMFALALGGALILDQPLCYYRLHSPTYERPTTSNAKKCQDYHHRFVKARDYELTKFLMGMLPQRLSELGVTQEVIAAFFESDRLEMERYELQRDGGGRWRTFKAEVRGFQASYKNSTAGYKLFKNLIGLLALVLPPQRFYDLRYWYSRQSAMHSLRGLFGRAEPVVPNSLFQRRPVTIDHK
ncbi:MAG: glycosyltransferase [Candidatus Korobacteraceae bacterium]|jgi:glycosyltransferase involved in cell wall biosynthesis